MVEAVEPIKGVSDETSASDRKMRPTLQRLIKLPVRLLPKATSIVRRMSSASSIQEPFKFFGLPRELRDEIYVYYFAGKIGLSSSNQPCSLHAAAILLASRLLRDEAQPIMFKHAVFTINLAPKYSRIPGRDLAYYMDHHLAAGELFAGSKEVFARFPNVSHSRQINARNVVVWS